MRSWDALVVAAIDVNGREAGDLILRHISSAPIFAKHHSVFVSSYFSL